MRSLLISVLLALTAAGGAACSGTHEPGKDKAAVAKPSPRPRKPVLDVPAIVGLKYDELRRKLGPVYSLPANFADPMALPLLERGELHDSSGLLRVGPLAIVATFDVRSRRVSDLVLLGTDEEVLMQQGQLSPNSEKYLILPVFQLRRPDRLMGLRVVDKAVQ